MSATSLTKVGAALSISCARGTALEMSWAWVLVFDGSDLRDQGEVTDVGDLSHLFWPGGCASNPLLLLLLSDESPRFWDES